MVTKNRVAALAAMFVVLPAVGFSQVQSRDAYGKAYWQGIIASDFALPADASLPVLVQELSGYLASTDPQLRDDIAYSVLTQWIYVKRIVPPELSGELIAQWSANLRRGIGEQGNDSVILRSFSALMLSVAVALDNEVPYLDDARFDRLLDAALAYLRDERDVRGFDAEKGWLHSVAHTADLLKFLGRNRHLEGNEQSAILTAIADKLAQLDHVLVHGEDERLARAVVSIAARDDADMAALETFLNSLKPLPIEGLPTPAGLALNQNRKHLAVSLYAVLNTDGRELKSLRDAGEMTLALLGTM